jgi:hypothetical protein
LLLIRKKLDALKMTGKTPAESRKLRAKRQQLLSEVPLVKQIISYAVEALTDLRGRSNVSGEMDAIN